MSQTAFGCVRNTIRLLSGRYIDLAGPRPEDIELSDIAGGLSKICRFGGQIERFYSVAEHSVQCAMVAIEDKLPKEAVAAVLMHDAAEAYIGDMVKPLKLMMPEFSRIERTFEAAISAQFGIDFAKWDRVIREIDQGMLIAERRHLFSSDGVLWTGEQDCRQIQMTPFLWRPADAFYEFTRTAREVGVV